MTPPLAHTAIGAKPRPSTTGGIHRGGRPVASTNSTPASMAACTASRVRTVTFSSSPSRVPSTSQAIKAGRIMCRPLCPICLRSRRSMRSVLALSGAGDAIGSVPAEALLQFVQPERLGVLARRRATAKPARHPVLAFRVRVLLLHLVQQLVHRRAQGDVEFFRSPARGQRAAATVIGTLLRNNFFS